MREHILCNVFVPFVAIRAECQIAASVFFNHLNPRSVRIVGGTLAKIVVKKEKKRSDHSCPSSPPSEG